MSGKAIDITGQRFGRWTVLEKVENKNGRDAKFLCLCDCGTKKEVLGKNLRNGQSKSCGCYKNEKASNFMKEWNKNNSNKINLTNQKFGLLTAIEETSQRTSQGAVIWKCKCDCGNIHYVSTSNLKGKHSVKSCGCLDSSYGELLIENILKENNIEYIKEYRIKELNNKRFDFAIIKNNTIQRFIEYDGRQHYEDSWESLESTQKKDQEKNQYAKEHNIPLVRIPYWQQDKITLEMLLGDKYLV